MQPTIRQYPDTWHAAEEDQERAWLDDWMRGRVCPATLQVCSRTTATVPALTVAGSC
ncbi:hypothetical protein [Streptomyces sp. SID161]|uniref:hypothetical protein n=1 Tax=Streptomyces sp. SID161 TaxID=2690251 RepID=UPI00136A794F|nr:hypothetical protein [Streptomyces sp. SID161]MYW49627.1 hypothetical protein [Streptomyces sp. SID161]